MIDSTSINSMFDARVVDRDGEKIGTVKRVYVDNDGGQPLFASVATGLFGTSESFVPLRDAVFDGDSLRVAHDKATVKDAPRIDADAALTDEEQDRLWDYYATEPTDASRREAGAGPVGQGNVREEAGSPADAMTRSEERLDISKESVPAGRVRLRKHVVTEQNITVPVRHEEVRVERELITGENVDESLSGPDLAENEHDVDLNEERVVVDKETVPVERVRLEKEAVTEHQDVSEEVAHEEIELDEQGSTRDE